MEIYAVAAQVIPILLFAMVFESRVLDSPPSTYGIDKTADPDDPARWNVSQAIARWYALAVMGLGEFMALNAVGLGKAGPFTRATVWAALLIGIGGVLFPLLGRQWTYIRRWLAVSREHGELGFLAFVMLLMVALSFGWLSIFYA